MSLKEIILNAKEKQQVCANCDEKHINLLDFAHWSRNEKNGNISDLRVKENLIRELSFGRFLCLFCHKNETDQENAQIQVNKEKEIYREAKKNATTKCLNCSQFVNKKSIRKSRCTICEYKRQNFYYVNSRRTRDFIKRERGKCNHCSMVVSKNNLNLFEFDHISGVKCGNIGDMKNIDDIIQEAKKCQLLCSKCHRLKTLRQTGYFDS